MSGGRPSKLTPEVTTEIVRALQMGVHVSVACAVAGITKRTFDNWMLRGGDEEEGPHLEFRCAVERAEARTEMLATGTVMKAVRDGNWRAALEWLERRHRARWAPRHLQDQDDELSPFEKAARVREDLRMMRDSVPAPPDSPPRSGCG